jgi:hypothetical protein
LSKIPIYRGDFSFDYILAQFGLQSVWSNLESHHDHHRQPQEDEYGSKSQYNSILASYNVSSLQKATEAIFADPLQT